MKTLETISIVAISTGAILIIYNLVMFFDLNPFFVESDLISSTLGFATLCLITYSFFILKKLLNTQLKNNKADKLLTWTIRLFIAIGVLDLYIIVSMVTMLFKAGDMVMEPSSIFGTILTLLMNFVLLIGITIALSLVLIFLGNKLRKIKTESEHLFLIIGLTIVIYGVVTLLTTVTIIENHFILSIAEAATILCMGIIFKKYGHLPLRLDYQTLPVEKTKLVTIVEDEVTHESDQGVNTETVDKNDENNLDREDPRRFMPT